MCVCILLPFHFRCVVSDHDPDCWKYGLQKLAEVFAKQFLNYSSNITGTDKLKSDATAFVLAISSLRVIKYLDDWDSALGLPLMQLFPITYAVIRVIFL